jgi:hypothetical protein
MKMTAMDSLAKSDKRSNVVWYCYCKPW